METSNKQATKGGEFLIKTTDANSIFIPEEWTEEQLMIAQSCKDFLVAEVYPNLDRIDNMEPGLMNAIMTKAGELGLMGVSVPEVFNTSPYGPLISRPSLQFPQPKYGCMKTGGTLPTYRQYNKHNIKLNKF